MSSSEPQVNPDSSWFGHPRQLARLFTTEMWERFGFYGMRALLTLYLTNYFFFRDEVSAGLYGAFTALVYLTPLFGGLLADRYLGYKNAVKLGAVLMAIGYLGLCFGSDLAKPILKIGDEVHFVEIVKNPAPVSDVGDTSGENQAQVPAKQQFVTIDNVRYLLAGKEAGLELQATGDGGAANRMLAKGTFSFDGKRDPFWVNMLFVFLGCVIVGNGFFKPNISTMVGSLYPAGDTRRDAGFTIFYMGINLGSTFSQLLCPYLFEAVGPWAGFALAALGMGIAWFLIQFDGGRLDGYGEIPASSTAQARWLIYVGSIVAIPAVWWLMNNTMVASQIAAEAPKQSDAAGGLWAYFLGLSILGKALLSIFTAAVVFLPIWAFATAERKDAEKMFVAIVLVVFSVVFWTLFEQAGSSLTLFAERNTQLNVFGYQMPAGQTQSFNAIFIVIFAPVFSLLWAALAERKMEPSIPVKFSIGLIFAGLGFLVLVYGSKFADSNFKVGLFWLAFAYLLHSIGELCLSPVGLSMITKLSLPKIIGLMMGVWFLCTSMAQYVAGMIAQSAAVETVGGAVTNPEISLQTYVGVFQMIGLWGVGIGVGLLLISPILKRMMHGVN